MSFELVLPFDTDNQDFARGFEAGCIWTLMEKDPDALRGYMFHATNVEMVMRMLEKKQLAFKAHFTDEEGWMMLDD